MLIAPMISKLAGLFKRKSITFDQLLTLQMLVSQTVYSLESIPGLLLPEKKEMAANQASDLLEEVGIHAHPGVVQSAVCAALFCMNERRHRDQTKNDGYDGCRRATFAGAAVL